MLAAYLQQLPDAAEDHSGSHDGASAARRELEAVLTALKRFLLQDRSNYLECRTWLCTALINQKHVPGRVRRECLYPFVELSGKQLQGQVQPATLQLLQLWCEKRPQQAGRLLEDHPHIMKKFFKGSPLRITLWFAHFSMQGISSFKYGARALASFALTNREEVWHHLVWRGRHPQAPIAVANKPHYFCELDIVPTVENMLSDCPGFWISEVWSETLKSGDIIGIDYGWFCQQLLHILQGEDNDAFMMERALKDFVMEEDFTLLGQRLLHLLDSEQLLQLVNSLSSSSPSLAAALSADSASVQDLTPMIFSQAHWHSLDDVLLCHALSACRSQLRQMLDQDEEAVEQLQSLQQQSVQLQSSHSVGVHRAVLAGLTQVKSTKCRQLLLGHMWTMQLALMDQISSSPSVLPSLLLNHGIRHSRVDTLAAFKRSADEQPTPSSEAPKHSTTSDQPQKPEKLPTIAEQYALLSSSSSDEDDARRHKRKRKRRKEKDQQGKRRKKKKEREKKKKRARKRETKCNRPDSDSDSDSNSDSVASLDDHKDIDSDTSGSQPGDERSRQRDAGLNESRKRHQGRRKQRHKVSRGTKEDPSGAGGGEGDVVERADAVKPPWLLESWRVYVTDSCSVVGNAVDIVDVLTCHALRTWLLSQGAAGTVHA